MFIAIRPKLLGEFSHAKTFLVIQFLRISSNFCPFNLLLVQSQQAEIIIQRKAFYPETQQRNYRVQVQVELKPCNKGRCKKDGFTHKSTHPTNWKLYKRKIFNSSINFLEKLEVLKAKTFLSLFLVLFSASIQTCYQTKSFIILAILRRSVQRVYGPISASMRPSNTALFKEMLKR